MMIIWFGLLVFSILLSLMINNKYLSFYFLLIQEMFTLWLLLMTLILFNWYIMLLLLIKMGVPPMHLWMKPLMKTSSLYWFITFISLGKLPVFPVVFLFIGSSGLYLVALMFMVFIKWVMMVLLYSSGVLLYLFMFMSMFGYMLMMLYLMQFMLITWTRHSLVIYLLFSMSLPPTFMFFIKIMFMSTGSWISLLMLLSVLSISIYIYFNLIFTLFESMMKPSMVMMFSLLIIMMF